MPKRFTIKVHWGGLGDHLFHSHLPKIAKTAGGYDEVFVSERSEFRHPDYRRIVWEMNPYIDGFRDEDMPLRELPKVTSDMNLLDAHMLAAGLDDGLRWHEPEVHLEPEPVPELAGATIYDPNFVSYVGSIAGDEIGRWFRQKGVHIDYVMKPRANALMFDAACAAPVIETRDLAHYAGVIKSCGTFYCLTSGGATFAAALGRPVIALYGQGQKPMFHHSRLHQYVRVGGSRAAKRAMEFTRRVGRAALRRLK